MDLDGLAHSIATLLRDWVSHPLTQFLAHLRVGDRPVLYAMLAIASVAGFVLGRRRTVQRIGKGTFAALRLPQFQNSGELLVSRVLRSHVGPPHYHLLNHVTLQMIDGTTQVDHILVSRFGVFVVETKDYNGWIFANATGAAWTHVFYRQKFKFQNPILQNYRHVRAVQELLDFLPADAVRSIVVFTGTAEFKTTIPDGVIDVDQLGQYLRRFTDEVISQNTLQFCVGRLETARLAISGETDVEHVQSLAQRFGGEQRTSSAHSKFN